MRVPPTRARALRRSFVCRRSAPPVSGAGWPRAGRARHHRRRRAAGADRGRSQDFVIASHFLEHCQDPIGALHHMLRVTRPNGIVFLGVPDKRYTFDRNRPVTPFDHLVRDHTEGPAVSKAAHFEEWATLAEDENIRGRSARELMDIDYSIHFHVWTQAELLELFARLMSERRFPFDVESVVKNAIELIVVLRKQIVPKVSRDQRPGQIPAPGSVVMVSPATRHSGDAAAAQLADPRTGPGHEPDRTSASLFHDVAPTPAPIAQLGLRALTTRLVRIGSTRVRVCARRADHRSRQRRIARLRHCGDARPQRSRRVDPAVSHRCSRGRPRGPPPTVSPRHGGLTRDGQ